MHVQDKTILIASDDAGVRERFAAALESAGHRARGAADAANLLKAVGADQPRIDLLLLDLRLTSPGGADLVTRVQAQAAARVPVVAFSSSVTGAAEVRALAALGVSGYVNEHSAPPQILPALAPYLFPDSFNRRGSARVALGAPVACHAGETLIAAVAADLSRGGIGLRTTTAVDVGTTVRMRFRLPGHASEIEADACVVWSDPRTGLGAQFTGLDGDARRAIDAFVDANQ
jgi:uncharacterized protein (TIGR02266 family)